MQNSSLKPEQVITVYSRLHNRLLKKRAINSELSIHKYDLITDFFLLYPANFWKHKNHKMLLTAFGIYCDKYPESKIKLVFTGALISENSNIQYAITQMGLTDKVIITGFISNEELADLMNNCLGLVFPSLYEGFGLPILEAFSFEKPVLCSDITSLPEVAGDGAIYFDPRKPLEIVSALEKITNDDSLINQVKEAGVKHLQTFGRQQQMAQEYWNVLQDAFQSSQNFNNAVRGIYADGWCSNLITVLFSENKKQRWLEFEFFLPNWFPYSAITLFSVTENERHKRILAKINKGKFSTVKIALPNISGEFKFKMNPVVQPKKYNINDDTRLLGCQCLECKILSENEKIILWKKDNETAN